MKNLTKLRSFSLALCGCLGLALGGPVLAQHSGGGGHGGAAVSTGGGGYHGGGYAGGGYRGGYYGGYRGGYYGGYRGGYYGGYRGWYGYGGYRGWYGGYYPWGWGWGAGLGLGLYFATLPYYYSTYWYGGIPYYYANNTYYVYDDGAGQYKTVAPPAGAPSQPTGQAPAINELIAYPRNGQSAAQQATDKYECYRWAVAQIGYDPTSAGGGTTRVDMSDYYRAQAACLEGRGYTVK
jgi:hypothetical protein